MLTTLTALLITVAGQPWDVAFPEGPINTLLDHQPFYSPTYSVNNFFYSEDAVHAIRVALDEANEPDFPGYFFIPTWREGEVIHGVDARQDNDMLSDFYASYQESSYRVVAQFKAPEVVPIPAAVWLFGSALGLLGWLKRRTA